MVTHYRRIEAMTRLTCERILRRIYRMIGLIIAVVLGIIASTATAVTAGLVLHKEIQTAEFIKDWHKHSGELCAQENKIVG